MEKDDLTAMETCDALLWQRIKELNEDFEAGDLTEKGFWKQKYVLIKPLLPDDLLEKAVELEADLKEENITEKGYYKKLSQLLGGFQLPKPGRDVKNSEKLSEKNGDDIGTSSDSGIQEETVGPKGSSSPSEAKSENEKDKKELSKNSDKDNGSTNDENEVMEIEDSSEASSSSSSISKVRKKRVKLETTEEETSDDTSGKRNKGAKRKSSSSGQRSIMSMFQKSSTKRKSETTTSQSSEDEDQKQEEKRAKHEEDREDKRDLRTRPEEEIEEEIKSSLARAAMNEGIRERCFECRQYLDDPDLKIFGGDPEDAVDEVTAIMDPKLSLFTGNEEDVMDEDNRPENKITQFSIYDSKGHLVSVDCGIIEKNKDMYISGWVKAVYDENPTTDGGISSKKVGPIVSWYTSGFDGGEMVMVSISTAYGDYHLMDPSDEYQDFYQAVLGKSFLAKQIIEMLLTFPDATYEDLVNRVQTVVPPKGCQSSFTEEDILRHAQFLVEQVESYDEAKDDDEQALLVTTPCMRDLIKLCGVTLGKKKKVPTATLR